MARRKKHTKRPAPKHHKAPARKAPARKKRTAHIAQNTPGLASSAPGGELTGTPPIPYAPGYKAPREAQAKPAGPEPPDRTPLIRYSGKTMGVSGTVIDRRVTAMKQLRATHIKTPHLVRRKHG